MTRAQFLPLVILPALLGAFLAYFTFHTLNIPLLAITVFGVALLHLGANSIDDCFDYQNGVDKIANAVFPRDFAGWKPLPRGQISLRGAKLISYLLFLSSLSFAALLWYYVGIWAFILGVSGVILAVAYTAPPLKLDYRGLGLGEVSIFFAFGPIPVLGAYFVQTADLSFNAFLVSIPVGILTVTILLDHDLIFFEVYNKARKMSLAATIGKKKALIASFLLTICSYVLVIIFVAFRILPIWCLAAPAASFVIILRKKNTFSKPNEQPPYYLPFTVNSLVSNWAFCLILALSLLI
ncbi:MAG: UbiA family prenyltransferase [Nitrososphaerales archaeon]